MTRGKAATCTVLRCTSYARSADRPDSRVDGAQRMYPHSRERRYMSSSRHPARRGQASSAVLFGCHVASSSDPANITMGNTSLDAWPRAMETRGGCSTTTPPAHTSGSRGYHIWHAKGAFSGHANHRRPLFPHSAQLALLRLRFSRPPRVPGPRTAEKLVPSIYPQACRPPAEVLRWCISGASALHPPGAGALWLQSGCGGNVEAHPTLHNGILCCSRKPSLLFCLCDQGAGAWGKSYPVDAVDMTHNLRLNCFAFSLPQSGRGVSRPQ